MTIYILDEQPEKTAEFLDDRSLDRQIKEIVQVLLNITGIPEEHDFKFPFNKITRNQSKWSAWTSECKSNYYYLLKLGLSCCEEWTFRNNPQYTEIYNDKIRIMVGATIQEHELQTIIEWGKNEWNKGRAPDLPLHVYGQDALGFTEIKNGLFGTEPTPFPLVIPNKYLSNRSKETKIESMGFDVIRSYRNYYWDKLKKIKKSNSINLYEHKHFGKGYKLVKKDNIGWCELRKKYKDGSISFVGDFDYNLKEYKETVNINWTRRSQQEWLKL